MFKLVIADDEPSARYGIRDCIDWKQFNIDVVGEADDGTTALEIIEETKPDIVITDVKMSNMDGIKLAKLLREQNYNIKIIFISGYDDVDYIRSALKLDAIDYVLKPIDLEELENVISKVVTLIKEEKQKEKIMDQMEQKLLKSMPLLKEKFLIDLVLNDFEDISMLKEKLKFLNMNLSIEGKYCILIVNIDKTNSYKDRSEKDRQLTSFVVMNICQELINQYFKGYIVEKGQDNFLCIIELDEENATKNLYELATYIQFNLYRCLQLDITIAMGNIVNHISLLSESHVIAERALSQKLYLGKNQIITDDDIETNYGSEYYISLTKEEKIATLLKVGNEEKLMDTLTDFFSKLYDTKNTNVKYFQVICLQLFHVALKVLIELELNIEELRNEQLMWETILKADTLKEMEKIILIHYKTVNDFIKEKNSNKNNSVIVKIKDIIQQKYYSNITVNEIADEIFLTSNYICKIFKQETGITINEYLTKIRIEKSKEMLEEPQNKLYDICYAVGYSDPSYFNKVFKKNTGLSPSQFRRKLK